MFVYIGHYYFIILRMQITMCRSSLFFIFLGKVLAIFKLKGAIKKY